MSSHHSRRRRPSDTSVLAHRSERKESVTIHFRLHGATGLPKVGLLGQIDAYAKFSAGGHNFETKVVPNDKDPVWDLDCFFDVDRLADGRFQGRVELLVFDKSRFGDKLVGTALLDFAGQNLDELQELVLPVQYTPEESAKYTKQGRHSQLHVGVLGSMVSYAGFCRMLDGLPGVYFMQRTQHVYFPVPGHKRLMAGICYSPHAVEFKLALTKPNTPLFIDMDHGSSESTRLVKSTHLQGNPDVAELKIYDEVTTQGLKLTEDFDQTVLGCCHKELLHSFPVHEALTVAGWKGPAMAFEPRSRRLKPSNHETLLMLDYMPLSSQPTPRLKLCVMAVDSNSGRAYDIMVPQGHYEVPSELFAEPQPILDATQYISRTLEVQNLTLPAVLHGAQVMAYELTACQSWTLQDLIQPKGRVTGYQEDNGRVDRAAKTLEDGFGGLTNMVGDLTTHFGKVAVTVGKTADWAVTGAVRGAVKGVTGVVTGVAETAVGIKDVGQNLVSTTASGISTGFKNISNLGRQAEEGRQRQSSEDLPTSTSARTSGHAAARALAGRSSNVNGRDSPGYNDRAGCTEGSGRSKGPPSTSGVGDRGGRSSGDGRRQDDDRGSMKSGSGVAAAATARAAARCQAPLVRPAARRPPSTDSDIDDYSD